MSGSKCWQCRHSVPAIDKRGRQTAGCEWSLYKCQVPGWKARVVRAKAIDTKWRGKAGQIDSGNGVQSVEEIL